MRFWIALMALPWLTGMVLAPGQERERLAAERQVLLERFAAEERACHGRFVVTACVDELRVRRRAALAPLRARELALDDLERQQRASDRHAARAARPPPAAAASGAPSAPSGAVAAADRPAPAASALLRQSDAPPSADGHSSRALQAAERARAAAHRSALIDAAQAEVARKDAQRAASGKAHSALPTPASAPR